jgi:NADH:ubiquinone reductase (H+-translocating)
MQAGAHAGGQVMRRLRGQPTQPFRYRDKGTMATIGRHAAVADLPIGITLRGTIAWLAWLLLHLIYLIGFENRAQVLIQWAWNYCTWNWGPRLVIDRDP